MIGDGTLFIDTKEMSLINFDIDFTLSDGDKVLPSFLKLKDRQVFFDIAEQKTIISTDLWSLYVTFLKRDTMRAL